MKLMQYGLIGLLGGAIAIVGSGAPALAQNQSDVTGPNVSDITGPNVSDITGPNVSDNTGTIVDSIRFIDETTINQANELSRLLEEAYSACEMSQSVTGPRRFARGPSSPQDCTTTACVQFNQIVSQTQQFLSGLDPEVAEQFSGALGRLW